MKGKTGLTLCTKFAGSSEQLLSLLESMLSFNPETRLSAEECLKNPIFDTIRRPELERNAPWRIYLGCDKLDSFDYESYTDSRIVNDDQIREIIREEAE
jgi:serine/threonine protein kinase